MMKLGIVGRADSRGIAWQTLELVRHLEPDRVLCVLMNELGWPEDNGRFGKVDTVFVDSNLSQNLNKRILDETKCRKFLEGLDVVVGVETFYDWKFCDWARDAGCRTVLQANPEFAAHHHNPSWPRPDLFVWPTTWLLDDLDAFGYGDRVLPVPAVEREQVAADPEDDMLRILHVVGKAAAHDRNGTLEFIEACAGMRQPIHVTMVTQEQASPRRIRPGRNMTIDIIKGGVEDRWDMYRDQHLLVLPRKYGGLSLPCVEAMACGLAVLMPDCSPNEMWPGPRIPARKGRTFRAPFGKIQTYGTHPLDIMAKVDSLGKHRDRLADEMAEAVRWAELNSWTELKDRCYTPLLEEMT